MAISLAYKDSVIEISEVLVDTGSASTILSADVLSKIGITPAPEDALYNIRGVGGSQVVFTWRLDYLQIAEKRIIGFEVEVGGMDLRSMEFWEQISLCVREQSLIYMKWKSGLQHKRLSSPDSHTPFTIGSVAQQGKRILSYQFLYNRK